MLIKILRLRQIFCCTPQYSSYSTPRAPHIYVGVWEACIIAGKGFVKLSCALLPTKISNVPSPLLDAVPIHSWRSRCTMWVFVMQPYRRRVKSRTGTKSETREQGQKTHLTNTLSTRKVRFATKNFSRSAAQAMPRH